jgi:diguanylate cyclase (GGDEF)-like protein/PAS domain S-box-containing protein
MSFENKANNHELKQILKEHYPDLIADYSQQSRILYISSFAKKLLGYLSEDLIGNSLIDFIAPDDWLKLKNICNKQTDYFWGRIRHKQGHLIKILIGINSDCQIITVRLTNDHKSNYLKNQEEYLLTILSIQKELLIFDNKTNSYDRIVELLGKCSKASRVYIFENYCDDSGELFTCQKAEYCTVEIKSEIDNPFLKELSYSQGLPNWIEVLKQGTIIATLTKNAPETEKKLLINYGILSILIIPIIYEHKFIGCIGFIYCQEEYLWEQAEIDLLSTIATGIALALQIKEAKKALQEAESKYNNMFDNINIGIFQTSPSGYFLTVNTALAKIYGYDSPRELIEDIKNIEEQLYVIPQTRQELIKILEIHNLVLNFETQVYRKDGSIIWISENIRSLYDDNNQLLYYEGTVEDITARRVAEERLLYGALHDALTELPNRSYFMNKLQQVIQVAKNNPNYNYAVLFIDLDSFKVVNDSLGHLIGDELLQKVAQKVKQCVNVKHTIARFGGDEFAILLDDIYSLDEAIVMANNIKNQLKEPIVLKDYEIFVGASIGITSSNIQYQKPDEILRDADVAMYQAKGKGKGNYAIFNPEIQEKLLDRLKLESYLRRAIELKELMLHYQPIICLKTGKILGFEALIRWQHPERGFIPPNDFIFIAEETGLIRDIGWWVFCEASTQLKQWQENFADTQDLIMNINLSTYQLRDINLVEQIGLFITRNSLKGENIKLEITETCFLETFASNLKIINHLKQLGVELCIDDFGTGYSSLSRLHEFPIDTLKIDRAFVKSMSNKGGDTIILTILTLAHTLNMNVVAEGIETQEQLQRLQELGCEQGQGYLFSRPLNKEKATQLIVDSG